MQSANPETGPETHPDTCPYWDFVEASLHVDMIDSERQFTVIDSTSNSFHFLECSGMELKTLQ